MTKSATFDPVRLLRHLNDGGVRYLVIGGVAANLLGSPTVTADVDICYAPDRPNLEALARVLTALNARLRGADPGLPFRLDAKTLHAGDTFTFVTDAGDLDVLATPAGTRGFEDLVRAATPMEIDGMRVLVADINDLIRMKLAAARPKDLIEAEVLGALREELAAYG
jgi:predicted nucleotidyltransferase